MASADVHEAYLRGRAELQRYRDLFDHAPAIYVTTDVSGVIREANAAASAYFGATRRRIVGRALTELVASDAREDALRRLGQLARGEEVLNWEVRFRVPRGRGDTTAVASVSLERDERGAVVGLRWVFHDLTERKRAELQIAHLAFHDGLTGLPNKVLFDEVVTVALARAARSGADVALLYLDIDGFKLVNDRLGHSAGDELLCQIASRLVNASRKADTVARLGGDEFAVLLGDIEPAEGGARGGAIARRVAARISRSLGAPYKVGGAEVRVRVSVGMSAFPTDAWNQRGLLDAADAAMYAAKRVDGDAPVPGRAARSAHTTGARPKVAIDA